MSKDIRKWLCIFFAFVFLIFSTSMSIQRVFHSDVILSSLGIIGFAISILTLIFALSSLPKWQSFFGLAVFAYSIFWEITSNIGIH